MLNIGITGQNGFIGTHLFHTIGLYPHEFMRVEFKRSFFDSDDQLDSFVMRCDVIFHLAAVNRHENLDLLFNLNASLAKKLVASLYRTGRTPHVIMASSSQEELDNPYGKSKKKARELIAKWAKESGANFAGMIIPNVFGPFGRPFYNSVIATFCYQISRNQVPEIKIDKKLNLIYVGELIQIFLSEIKSEISKPKSLVISSYQANVSEILEKLKVFKSLYQDKGEIPSLPSHFDVQLFNTYRCFMDIGNYFPRKFNSHKDERGTFVELVRLGIGGQVSFSTTIPGVTRGNHFHTRKIERFAVVRGISLIQLRKIGTNQVLEFYLDGNEPSYVDMPIWYTHNIKNIGDEELLTVFWINEPFQPSDPDTYYEMV
jgi:UDP-2-acetamido-2,6-beta-L-arabino-hexul-4-ose reductase